MKSTPKNSVIKAAINRVTLIALLTGLILISVGALSLTLLGNYVIETGGFAISGDSIGLGVLFLGFVISAIGISSIGTALRHLDH